MPSADCDATATAVVKEMAAVLNHRVQSMAHIMWRYLHHHRSVLCTTDVGGSEGAEYTTPLAASAPSGVTAQFDVCPQAVLQDHLPPGATTAQYVSVWDEAQNAWYLGIAQEALPGIVEAAAAVEAAHDRSPLAANDEALGAHRLLLILSPANGTRWGRAKQLLLSHTTADVVGTTRWERILEDVALTTLALSKGPKVVEVWQHRRWAWGWLLLCINNDNALRRQPQSQEVAGKHLAIRETLEVSSWVWHQDEAVLGAACNQHPMNLNAWHYRRQMASLCTEGALFPSMWGSSRSGVKPSLDWRRRRVQQLCAKAVDHHATVATFFLRRHHADASCAAFLVDLLRTAVVHTQAWPSEGYRNVRPEHDGVSAQHDSYDSLRRVVCGHWTRSMVLSSQLLTQTCLVGHESLWQLRLGLVAIALQGDAASWRFGGDWTVADELAFAAHHSGCTPLPPTEGEPSSFGPLGDDVPMAWTASSGSVAFHRWYASRYGVLLLDILTR